MNRYIKLLKISLGRPAKYRGPVKFVAPDGSELGITALSDKLNPATGKFELTVYLWDAADIEKAERAQEAALKVFEASGGVSS